MEKGQQEGTYSTYTEKQPWMLTLAGFDPSQLLLLQHCMCSLEITNSHHIYSSIQRISF